VKPEDALREAIAGSIRHGQEALAAARALRGLGLRNDALSRVYYSAFHVATAVLLTEGVEPGNNRALPGMLLSHLHDRGFDASDAARLGRLAAYRDMADHERAFDASEEIVEDAFRDAELFVDKALSWMRARALSEPSPGA
jgi:uncharacterized protein (UPF0332 family)